MSRRPEREGVTVEVIFIRQMIAQRKHRKWSQAQLSREVGLPQTAVFKLELAVNPIDSGQKPRRLLLDEAVAISTTFGLSIEEMLGKLCETCLGNPPAGFTCQTCGAGGAS